MPGRILVVDDVPTSRLLARVRLSQAYYDVLEAADGETAIALAVREQPDLVLLDVVMPGMDGFAVCEALKSQPETAHIPIVMLTALDKRADRMRGLEAGADDFLTKPFDDFALLSRVNSLTRMKMLIDELRLRYESHEDLGIDMLRTADQRFDTTGANILLVTRSEALAAEMAAEMKAQLGCRIDWAGGKEDMVKLMQAPHDAYIIGSDPADGDPMRLASMLRGRPDTRQAALMMMFEKGDKEGPRIALDIGVYDYITLPPDYPEIAARLRVQLRRKHYSDMLRTMLRDSLVQSATDSLTGLHNRGHAHAQLGRMIDHAGETGQELMVMLLDLDRFKSINDRYGHPAGDAVLVEFAKRLKAGLRCGDLLGRVGGEEFLVAMPDTGAARAQAIAERVRQSVEAPDFPIEGSGARLRVTVSIGITPYRPGETLDEVLRRSDQALYRSKHAGRNRVTLDAA